MKTLLEDKRYDFVETGSLASITKKSKDILIYWQKLPRGLKYDWNFINCYTYFVLGGVCMKKAFKRSLSILLALTIIFSSAYVGLNEIDLYGCLSINKFRNFENIKMILKDIR